MPRGRPRKAVSERQGRVPPPALVIETEPALAHVVPDPPKGLLRSSRALWDQLWSSPLARAWNRTTDQLAVEELVRLVDERERAWRAYRRQRFVEGSRGQVRVNPVWTVVRDTTAQILQLSDRLGLTPRARLQLGIKFTEAAMGVAELNRMLDHDSPA